MFRALGLAASFLVACPALAAAAPRAPEPTVELTREGGAPPSPERGPARPAEQQAGPEQAGPELGAPEQDAEEQAARGPLYAPQGPGEGRFRLGLGLLFDVLSPYAVAGLRVAVPNVLVDARLDLGEHVSLLGHLNTILVMNQLELGVGLHGTLGPLGVQARAFGGVLAGALEGFGFATVTVAPLVRPGVVLGAPIGDHWVSLGVDMLLVPVQQVKVGSADVTISSFNAFFGLSATLTLEHPLKNGGEIFYGAALMYTRASYQAWVLFSDEPNLLAYPRIFAGYAF